MATNVIMEPHKEESRLKDIVKTVLHEAKKCGASECEVGINLETGIATNVRLETVENLEFNCDQGIGVTVYFGKQKGSASTSNFNIQAIKNTVQAACDICKYSAADSFSGLADPELMARQTIDLDLYHPWDINPNEAIKLAIECEAAGRSYNNKVFNSDGATFSSHQGCSIYANSNDFLGSTLTSRHGLSASIIASDGVNMERDYWYTVARDPKDLEQAASVGLKAAKRAIARLGAQKKSQDKTNVLFSSEISNSIIRHLISAISGSSLYRKSSFLLDYLDKQIFPNWIHIHEDPLIRKQIGSASYDQDGLATKKKDFIKDGILTSYLLSTYSARRLKMQSTANAGGISNLFIKPNTDTQADMIKTMHQGILVTELMGSSVNIVNGTYSRAAAGFWVENGEIKHPISEVTIAGNLKDMFANIVAVGADIDYRSNIKSGSILIEGMTLAG